MREKINAISQVVHNRPHGIRVIDQIYMRSGDLLLHVEWLSKISNGQSLVFIGDGDAVGLGCAYLSKLKLIDSGPREVVVLDFDERIVESINLFAARHGLNVVAELYNVVDPLPQRHWQKYAGFHVNPPYGEKNEGKSICTFLKRGVESLYCENSWGAVVMAHDRKLRWTETVLHKVQCDVLKQEYVISQFIPEFHQYILDDNPDLTSCTMLIRKCENSNRVRNEYVSRPLSDDELRDFYGNGKHLDIQYIRKKSGLENSDFIVEYIDKQTDFALL